MSPLLIERKRTRSRLRTDVMHSKRTPQNTADGMPEEVRVELFDGFRVSVGARVIEEGRWRLSKAASLVKLLALTPGHKLHREEIMALLWPNLDAEAAANNLRHAL